MSDFFSFTARDAQMVVFTFLLILTPIITIFSLRYLEDRQYRKEFEHRFRKNHR